MPENKNRVFAYISNIANISERIHSASFIIAAENWLLHAKKEMFGSRLNALKNKLLAAKEKNDKVAIATCMDEINKLDMKKSLFDTRIILKAAYKMHEESARVFKPTEDNPHRMYVIVVPKVVQDTITNGLGEDWTKKTVWTSPMKDAKNELRRRVLHEIAHILLSTEYPDVTENEAEEFVNALFEWRKRRHTSVAYSITNTQE